MSKFHNDPMINKSEVLVLVEQVWVYAGKDKVQREGHLFHLKHFLENPNSGCVRDISS